MMRPPLSVVSMFRRVLSPAWLTTPRWLSYGVVGLTSKNLVDGIAQVLVKDPTYGVEVIYDGQNINIELYVIIEYGTRIKSVTDSVIHTVRFQVEKALGMPVNEVNVHVRGLRISNFD